MVFMQNEDKRTKQISFKNPRGSTNASQHTAERVKSRYKNNNTTISQATNLIQNGVNRTFNAGSKNNNKIPNKKGTSTSKKQGKNHNYQG